MKILGLLGRYLEKVKVTYHSDSPSVCGPYCSLKFWLCGPLWITYNRYDLLMIKLFCVLSSYRINFLCYEKLLEFYGAVKILFP